MRNSEQMPGLSLQQNFKGSVGFWETQHPLSYSWGHCKLLLCQLGNSEKKAAFLCASQLSLDLLAFW